MAAVTKDFLLGIGAEYSPIAGQKANYSGSVLGTSLGNGSYNKENSYNIFLSPATPVGNDGLLYGKVGYTGASIKDTFGSITVLFDLYWPDILIHVNPHQITPKESDEYQWEQFFDSL